MQELAVLPVYDNGQTTNDLCPSTTVNAGTDEGLHLVASALKDLTATSTVTMYTLTYC